MTVLPAEVVTASVITGDLSPLLVVAASVLVESVASTLMLDYAAKEGVDEVKVYCDFKTASRINSFLGI